MTVLWRKQALAVIGIIALSATSCRSPGTLTASVRHDDSLRSVRREETLRKPVPPSLAKTAFPTDLLKVIPVGTGFSRRSGRATVNVTRISPDSLEVTATCDSLAREVVRLTEELTRIRSETEQQEKELPPKVVREPTGWQWFQIWTGRVAVLLLVLMLITRRLKVL